MHPLVEKDKIKAFIKKLKLWKFTKKWATANIEANKNLFV